MKYLFKRGGRVWHIVKHYHLASTTGAVMFCSKRVVVPDFEGHSYRAGLFRHRDVVESIKIVPPIDPQTLEHVAGRDADLSGPVCRDCVRALRRKVMKDYQDYDHLGDMAGVLFPDLFGLDGSWYFP